MSQTDSKPIEQVESSGSNWSGNGQDMCNLVATLLQNAKPGTAISSVTGQHTVTGKLMNHLDAGSGKSVVIGPLSLNLHVEGPEINTTGQQSNDSEDTEHDGYLQYLKDKLTSKKEDCCALKKPSCALVINNIFNEQAKGPQYLRCNRQGAEGDTQKLRKLFNDLKFAYVQTKENVSSYQLAELLTEFRKIAKVLDCGACFIALMSHGGKAADSIVMNDLNAVDLYWDIVYQFSDHDDVRARPKIFLVQACRDSRETPVLLDSKPKPAIGRIQEILIGHSTIPHEPAGRDAKKGALYIDVITKVFRDNVENSTIKSMLRQAYYKLLRDHGQKAQVQDFGFEDCKLKL